jgi:tetratricopeptide (TPR) repeat protein
MTVLAEPAPAKGASPAAAAAAAQPADAHLAERHTLMVCEFRQGELQASVDKREEALAAFRRALVVAEALLVAQPTRPERQFEVATVSDRVADLLTALNLWEEALTAHERSMALAESLAANDRENEPQWQFYVKDKLEHIADLQLSLGRSELALENYRRGVDLGEKLVTLNVANEAWLGSMLGLIAKLGSTEGLPQTAEERRQLLLHGLELLGRVRSGEIWDNSEEWADRLRQALDELPPPGQGD